MCISTLSVVEVMTLNTVWINEKVQKGLQTGEEALEFVYC